MSILGNILWVLFGGLFVALGYMISGLLLCLTIIGIPFGIQTFKIGIFALLPFGKTTVVLGESNGCLSAIMNILWILIGGIWIALAHFLWGVVLCITLIGIPFGLQHFKLMSIAFTPFGRVIVNS